MWSEREQKKRYSERSVIPSAAKLKRKYSSPQRKMLASAKVFTAPEGGGGSGKKKSNN